MSRDIKIYLLIVVLPAILLVAGGFRLIELEYAREREILREGLQERSNSAVRQIKESIKALRANEPLQRGSFSPKNKFRPRPPNRSEGHSHDLPKEIADIFKDTIDFFNEESEAKILLELHHDCGFALIESGAKKPSSICAKSRIEPFFGDWLIVALPLDGDDALEAGMWRKAAFTGILILLLLATLTAGCTLLVRAQKRSMEEARRKTDFISNISHELKTPLTSITLFSQMLSEGALTKDASAKASSTILKEARRLGHLIDGLLDYARLERKKMKYDIVQTNVAELVEEAVNAHRLAFPNGLRITEPHDGLIALADREATRRAIDCVLENAAKYAARYGEVTIATRGANSKIEISIADSGPGISKEDARHIFERFWRADNSITRTSSGTGMGLAIARDLLKGMSADISYKENVPRGAIFTIRLAAAKSRER